MKDICSQYAAMYVREFNQLQSSIEFLQRILNFFQWTCEIFPFELSLNVYYYYIRIVAFDKCTWLFFSCDLLEKIDHEC